MMTIIISIILIIDQPTKPTARTRLWAFTCPAHLKMASIVCMQGGVPRVVAVPPPRPFLGPSRVGAETECLGRFRPVPI